MMTNEERITLLLAARLAGEATDAELRELETLLARDPSQHARAQLLQRYFNDTPIHSPANTEQALERTLARIRSAESAGLPEKSSAAGEHAASRKSIPNAEAPAQENPSNTNEAETSGMSIRFAGSPAHETQTDANETDASSIHIRAVEPASRQEKPSAAGEQDAYRMNLLPADSTAQQKNPTDTGESTASRRHVRSTESEKQPAHATDATPAGTSRKRILFRRWAAVAAGIALLIGSALALWGPASTEPANLAAFHPESDTARWLHRQNGKAIRAVLELADGSKIWLNADSKLSYPDQFGPHTREVFLTGEAFFQVASTPEKPFIVHLNKGTIRVLGTSFNVRAYDDEPVQTSVSTGKVAFIPKYTDARVPDTFYITPDEKVTWHADDPRPEKAITSGEEDRAWTDGGLVFRDASLEDICRELERTFGKKVEFDSDAPRHYRLTGAFRNNSLQEILFYLSRSKNFRYTITDSTLLIGE